MGSVAESVSLEKEGPYRSPETGGPQAAPDVPGVLFDPFVERLFGGAPAEPPDSAAESLSVQRLQVPVLQRAQRLYGNRASQQIVMRARTLQRRCACGGTCPKCREEDEQRALQRSSTAHAPAEFDDIPATPGEPLDVATRRPLESHFGTDLADVRVHTGSDAAKSATQLDSLAYTAGRDIYFAAGMYSPANSGGQRLLAHEVAHVVQQSSGKEPTIATKSSRGVKIGAPDDMLEDEAERRAEEFMTGAPNELTDEEQRKKREAGTVQRFIQRQAAPDLATSGTPSPATGRPQPNGMPAFVTDLLQSQAPSGASDGSTQGHPDPAQLAKKKAEVRAAGQPAVNKANKDRPQLEKAANAAKNEAQKAPQPDKAAKLGAAGAKSSAKDKTKSKGKGGGKVSGALGGAVSPQHAKPSPPPPVQPPKIAVPVDAAGKPLVPDVSGDAAIVGLAAMAQAMRLQGHMLRERAAQERHNAGVIQGNMAKIHEGISKSEEGIGHSEDHLSYRREVVGQSEGALQVSEQKADMVASEAPKYQSKSAEGKAKSGPMAGEAKGLGAENASKTPDDPDAAQKSQEQGQKINKVGSDIGSMDDAMTQTKSKADSLAGEAAQAKQTNAQTKQNIAGTHEILDQTGAKLTQMSGQNTAAQAQLATHASGPPQILAGATALDMQGQAAIQASVAMEQRLHAAQAKYLDGMRGVPQAKRGKTAGSSGPPVLVQRQADPTAQPGGRVDLNLAGKAAEALPSWLTGEEKQTEQQRAEAQAAEQQRRQAEIAEINAKAGGDFSKLTAADKAGIALSLTGRHLFGSVAGIKWPDMLGKMAQGLVDPRMALMGIVSGLSMVLSGGANLFSAEQWSKDPLGNLLKSAADIATGITIILGSITALAMAIIAILVAAAILTLGALGPVAAAVIPFCWTIVATVGPWTIEAAAIALELNVLLMIKDLIDAATADTATKLQGESDKVTEDAKTAGNMAMQIGMAAVGEAGGEALMSTEFGQGMAAGARDIGEEFGIVKPTGGAAPALPEAAPAEPRAAAPTEAAPAKASAAAPPEAAPAPKPAAENVPPPAETPAVPKVEGAPSAEGGTAPKPEAAPPSEAPAKTAPEGTEAGEAAKPRPDEHAVAQEPTADGHTAEVTEDGECRICSGPPCPKVADKVEAELADSDVPPEQQAQIEADLEKVNEIKDPAAKAKAGAEVQAEAKELSELQKLESMQQLLERMDERGLTFAKLGVDSPEAFLEFLGDDPEAGIAKLNEQINVKEVEAQAQAGVPTKEKVDVPAGETGTRGMEIREAHDIGVEHGRQTAIEMDKLTPEPWENPLGHRGGFGQGIDDIMINADGDPVIVEYKGGGADLSPNQMSREWVQTKIDELRAAGDIKMADRLQTALDSGKLQGQVYRTPIDANGQPLTTMRDPRITYAPKGG